MRPSFRYWPLWWSHSSWTYNNNNMLLRLSNLFTFKRRFVLPRPRKHRLKPRYSAVFETNGFFFYFYFHYTPTKSFLRGLHIVAPFCAVSYKNTTKFVPQDHSIYRVFFFTSFTDRHAYSVIIHISLNYNSLPTT